MASVYVHLSGRDVDDELLKLYGIKQDKPKEFTNCLRCRELNDPTAKFCKRCGLPLSMKESFTLFEKKQQKEEITSKVLEKLFEKLKSQLDIDSMVKQTILELGMEKEFKFHTLFHNMTMKFYKKVCQNCFSYFF